MAKPDDAPSFVVLPDEYDNADGTRPAGEVTGAGHRPPRLSPGLARLLAGRRARLAGVLLAVLGCVAAGTLTARAALDQHGTNRQPSAAGSGVQLVPAPLATAGSWPQTAAACGSPAYLPVLSSQPLRVSTGVRLTVGGRTLHTVDLDSGAVSSVAGLSLSADQFVAQVLRSGADTYALVQPCESTDRGSVIRVGPDGKPVLVASNRHIAALFSAGDGQIWASELADFGVDGPITMVRLAGTDVVTLPAGLVPVAIGGDRLLGLIGPPAGPGSPLSGRLVSFDLASHRLGASLGRVSSVTASAGWLVWTEDVCSAAAPCLLHRYDLSTGLSSTRGYSLPVEASVAGGVLSPDHTKLAFALNREFQDPRYDTDGLGPPSDLVVLDLHTGVLEGIPNLELPPTSSPGLAFSDHGNWLIIALNEGSGTRLLAWQAGLAKPLESPARVSGEMLQAPPLVTVGG